MKHISQRKRCPVCRIDRTYQGVICPACICIGYRVGKDGKPRRKLKRDKTDLDGILSKKWQEIISKTVRASKEIWEGLQILADFKGVSVNTLIVAIFEMELERQLDGKE